MIANGFGQYMRQVRSCIRCRIHFYKQYHSLCVPVVLIQHSQVFDHHAQEIINYRIKDITFIYKEFWRKVKRFSPKIYLLSQEYMPVEKNVKSICYTFAKYFNWSKNNKLILYLLNKSIYLDIIRIFCSLFFIISHVTLCLSSAFSIFFVRAWVRKIKKCLKLEKRLSCNNLTGLIRDLVMTHINAQPPDRNDASDLGSLFWGTFGCDVNIHGRKQIDEMRAFSQNTKSFDFFHNLMS